MKIIYENSFTKGPKVLIGQIESFDQDYLDQFDFKMDETKGQIQRQVQSHFARVLLAQELDIQINRIQNKDRVPFVDGLNASFSLSHTEDKVAIVIGEKRVGIDIEKQTNKILRIKHKFVREDEADFIGEERIQDGASVIWGAKESMFKLYSKGAVSYLNDLKVEAFDDFQQAHFDCKVMKEEEIICKGYHELIDNYRLVSVWED